MKILVGYIFCWVFNIGHCYVLDESRMAKYDHPDLSVYKGDTLHIYRCISCGYEKQVFMSLAKY